VPGTGARRRLEGRGSDAHRHRRLQGRHRHRRDEAAYARGYQRRKLDNRHVVKAFVEPPENGDSFKVASNDPEARAAVEALIEGCGCHAIDAGPLERAGEIEREAQGTAARPG